MVGKFWRPVITYAAVTRERFAELSGEQTHPQTKSFFEKVRELFG